MTPKFKIYRIEKVLFIILSLILILNCYPYMSEEIKMISTKIENRNNPLFARLELGSPCCTPGLGMDSEESRNTVKKHVESLGEDAENKVKEASEAFV